jgi:hypothetical protein
MNERMAEFSGKSPGLCKHLSRQRLGIAEVYNLARICYPVLLPLRRELEKQRRAG